MCGAILEQNGISNQHEHNHTIKDWRRRSVDVGGLGLATKNSGQGQGWLGGCPEEVETIFAELLSDMYTETTNSVNENSLDFAPADLSESVRSRLIHSLDRWHFEPHLLPDQEVIACTLILFQALFRIDGMQEAIPISMHQISSFIHHLRRIYRYENTYHNFEHALDVLQACQSYLKSAGLVPSPTILLQPPHQVWTPTKSFANGSLIASLGLREIFMLYIAAIGHDVGHPGLTNLFMKDAKTRLSLVFENASPLEQMHSQLLLRVMKYNGLHVILEDPKDGAHLRKFLWQTVLATDMSVHGDFMEKFRKMVEGGEQGTICMRQIIVAQAILKNADISNPTRPFQVSKHWALALMKEWSVQASLEEEIHLPTTFMISPSLDDPLKEAQGQIFFIEKFVTPLLFLTVRAVPDMGMYLRHCKANLKTWKKREKEVLSQIISGVGGDNTASTTTTPPASVPLSPALSTTSTSTATTSSSLFAWYHSAFPLALPSHPTILPPAPPTLAGGEESLASPTTESSSSTTSGSLLFSPISSDSNQPQSQAQAQAHVPTQIQTRPSTSSSSSSSASFTTSIVPSFSGLSIPSSPQAGISESHAAIRAASRVGSLRAKESKTLKEGGAGGGGPGPSNRNSWCVGANGVMKYKGGGIGEASGLFANLVGSNGDVGSGGAKRSGNVNENGVDGGEIEEPREAGTEEAEGDETALLNLSTSTIRPLTSFSSPWENSSNSTYSQVQESTSPTTKLRAPHLHAQPPSPTTITGLPGVVSGGHVQTPPVLSKLSTGSISSRPASSQGAK